MERQSVGRIVDVGDVPVLLEAGDATRWHVITALLPGLRHSAAQPLAAVRYLAEAPPLPRRDPDQSYADVRVWAGDDHLFLQYANDARAQVSGREAHIGGGREYLDVAFARLFHPAVTHLLAGHGRFVVHAAAITGPSGGWLVLGQTGAGKSTLALAALHAGWGLLGDDLAVLRWAADRPEVTGIARRTAVPGDLRTGALAGARALAGDHRNRWEIAPDRLAHGWFPLAGVVLAAHGDGAAGTLRRCASSAVFDTALGSFTAIRSPSRLRRYLPCAAALARLPAWELRLGSEPVTRVADAARLLGDAAAAARSRVRP